MLACMLCYSLSSGQPELYEPRSPKGVKKSQFPKLESSQCAEPSRGSSADAWRGHLAFWRSVRAS